MSQSLSTNSCSACDEDDETFQYHGPNLSKMQLCRRCYDQYLAKEMVNYWKNHMEEEERRTGK